MSTDSGSPSASSAGTGKKRTRNAQAQADLRVRRKNYIKTLEDTVSSLEACVRQLRCQNAELTRRASSCSSSIKDVGDDEKNTEAWHELRAENARLHAILAEAGLTANKDADAEPSTRPSPKKAKSSIARHGATWSSTCSITTKKRKLSKMQLFAQQVDSQLSGGVASNTTNTPSYHQEGQHHHQQQQQAYPSLTDKNAFYLPDHTTGFETTVDTPSSSRSSRGDSVVSHRSPKTPRFESMVGALPDEKADLLAFDVSTSAAPAAVASLEAAWYDTPVVLAPVSTAAAGVNAQVYAQEASMIPHLPAQTQQVEPWMIRPQLPATTSPASTPSMWPLSFHPNEYSSSMFNGWLPDAAANAQQHGVVE
ncbi:hypothetical protein EX895_000472 [Sporisorium graminicola]|uniref:BZIP domain-containing protein n=1 Tax=Sporisorium graminicola TaxID=280036 RepID=A0A4U7KZY3_9BASI|nr:hypothetical protein EX895_000472 [Sporisorium graminicola]TKY90474.1 hypothetical protein EX895_000472 [Sporisorium graminicola]